MVSYTSVGSTATGGTDYTALTGTVTILAGQTSATIDVSGIVDDNLVEADETVVVTLTSVTSGDPQITLNGAADDRAPSPLSTTTAPRFRSRQRRDGQRDADRQRPVHRQPDPGELDRHRGQLHSVAGTATGGTDYTTLTGTVTILAGKTSATIDVSGIVDDNIVEANETVVVTLTSRQRRSADHRSLAPATRRRPSPLSTTTPPIRMTSIT